MTASVRHQLERAVPQPLMNHLQVKVQQLIHQAGVRMPQVVEPEALRNLCGLADWIPRLLA